MIAVKALRRAIGKLSHIANLLIAWRPFMAPLYAALYGPRPEGAPTNCIWTRQIVQPLKWFRAFFNASGGFIERRFNHGAFARSGKTIEIVLDASPWGLAGILIEDCMCIEYFSDAISSQDVDIFQHDTGTSDGQQIWESLAALIALRRWKHLWGQHSMWLRVKGDSVTMLTLIVNMRPTTPQLALIGQEIALEFADVPFVPVIAMHIPGVANVAADELSRWWQPGHVAAVPTFVGNAPRAMPPARNREYYLTLEEDIGPDKLVN